MLRKHYANELAKINRLILKMGLKVKESIVQSLEALESKDPILAQKVIDEDEKIDSLERELCDFCALIMAKEQPVAKDLRHLISCIRVITDLERIGDYGVHIAQSAIKLKDTPYLGPLVDIPQMGMIGLDMLIKGVDAFVTGDTKKATDVALLDKEIDNLNNHIIMKILSHLITSPNEVESGLELILISRYLERFGDHVKNICEWVIFSQTAEHGNL